MPTKTYCEKSEITIPALKCSKVIICQVVQQGKRISQKMQDL